jgi:hypothetical protein
MKIQYEPVFGNLIQTECEYKSSDIRTGQVWFSKEHSRKIEIDNYSDTRISFWVYSNIKPKYISMEFQDFIKEYSLVIAEEFFRDITTEQIFQIIRDKDNRYEMIEHLSGYLDNVDIEDLIEKIRKNNPKDYNNIVRDRILDIEQNTEFKFVKIDTLEKQYLYEQFMEQLDKI